MKIINERIILKTKGAGGLMDITGKVAGVLGSYGLKKGNVTVFVVGQTAAIATFEYKRAL